MTFVDYIDDYLTECDLRMFLRDSGDLFKKSIDTYSSAKRIQMKRSVFSEHGYDEQWLQVMRNLWRHWQVDDIREFEKKMDDLTAKDRVEMIEEIITSEMSALMLRLRKNR